MRSLSTLALTAAMIGFAAADEATMKTVAGKWEVMSVTRDGQADDSLKGAIRQHDDAKYTVTPPAGSSAAVVAGAFVVDATKTPATIDMKPTGGRYKDKTLKGIVKLDGDRMTIAFAEPEKARPKEFES